MEIKTKIVKQGGSYSMRIPKALIECKILDTEKEYIINLVKENGALSGIISHKTMTLMV